MSGAAFAVGIVAGTVALVALGFAIYALKHRSED